MPNQTWTAWRIWPNEQLMKGEQLDILADRQRWTSASKTLVVSGIVSHTNGLTRSNSVVHCPNIMDFLRVGGHEDRLGALEVTTCQLTSETVKVTYLVWHNDSLFRHSIVLDNIKINVLSCFKTHVIFQLFPVIVRKHKVHNDTMFTDTKQHFI